MLWTGLLLRIGIESWKQVLLKQKRTCLAPLPLSADEYGALGEDFEKREHVLLGDNGFEDMVDRVATIEKTLGIFDLAQFTPKG